MIAQLLQTPTTANRRGGLREYISPSRLNLWLKCPLAFKLRYVDRVQTPTSASLFLGKIVHAGLEILYRHRQLGVLLSLEDVVQRMHAGWDESVEQEAMLFESAIQEDAMKRQAADLIAVYLERTGDDDEILLNVETTLQEPLIDPFSGQELGIPLLGVLDLILDEHEGPVICDFKTAARSAAPFEVTHEIQLSCYSYLFRRASGREEGGLEIRSLIKTKKPKLDFHRYEPRSQQHFRRLFAAIRAYLDELDSGRFIFRPGMGCNMCEYRDDHCGRWNGD